MGREFNESQIMTVEVLSAFIDELIASQKKGSNAATRPLRMPVNHEFPNIEFFRTDLEPNISIRAYVERTVAYMRCTQECYVFAATYLRRAADSGFPMNLRTIHRLYITALVVAAKIRDDLYYSMSYYGQIGGVSARDLGRMELHFLLNVISFEGNVSKDEYAAVCTDMGRALAATKERACSLPAGLPDKVVMRASTSESGLSDLASTRTSPVTENLHASKASLWQQADAIHCAWTVQAKVFSPGELETKA